MTAAEAPRTTERVTRDPYATLDAHVMSVRALHCEDGCGAVETSGYSIDDRAAADELARAGWAVRPHSMGGLTSLCKTCTEKYDRDQEDDRG